MIEINLDLQIDDLILNDSRYGSKKRGYFSPADFSEIKLSYQPEFNPLVAMELGNLTRISYKDYELFEDKTQDLPRPFEAGDYIYAKNSAKQRIDKYYILSKNEALEEEDKSSLYEILDIFYYTSYNILKVIPEIYRPNTSRFGFIAKQGTRIFVIIRGTREGEEWFNNAQPHHINFFQRELKFDPTKISDPQSYGVITSDVRVHWGFHKIYTDFRPGPFLKIPVLNVIFSSPGKSYIWLTERFSGNRTPKNFPSMWDVVEQVFKRYYSPGDQVFASGHSLGGALATLAALHIGYLKNCHPIIYTFASPRVGNTGFAKYFKLKMGKAFRIANTEDVVPNLGSAAIKISGLEMSYVLPSEKREFFLKKLQKWIRRTSPWSKFMNWITAELYEEGYHHVGQPVVFTFQTRRISSNHNMNAVYCGVIENEVKALPD